LENLTQKYVNPCVLDLKMGSQPHNPLKYEKQIKKIQSSTSATQGFRISGMQVGRKFFNKYWGRSVTDENIVSSLS
jgi:inositol-hexakisphosphate 5-kinase